jgi:hypothetical protein
MPCFTTALYAWIQNIERLWRDHLARIKQVAEQTAKEKAAARDRAAANDKKTSKENRNGR